MGYDQSLSRLATIAETFTTNFGTFVILTHEYCKEYHIFERNGQGSKRPPYLLNKKIQRCVREQVFEIFHFESM